MMPSTRQTPHIINQLGILGTQDSRLWPQRLLGRILYAFDRYSYGKAHASLGGLASKYQFVIPSMRRGHARVEGEHEEVWIAVIAGCVEG